MSCIIVGLLMPCETWLGQIRSAED